MTTYVFGAGASRHAGYPLAAALGTRLAKWTEESLPPEHQYRAHIAQLKDLYSTLDNFEAIMTDLLQCPPGSPASTLPTSVRPYLIADIEEAIRECFDTIRPSPALLYDQLAQHHIQESDTVITFNYDLGIERSLRSAGRWEISDGYGFPITNDPPSSAVQVLKLHGSTNWRGLLFGGRTGFGHAPNSLGQRPVLFFRPDNDYLGYNNFTDPLCDHLSEAATVSAMILPSLNKTFYHQTTFGREWGPFWENLWQRAENALQTSGRIVIIGYSLPAADERARDLLLSRANKNASVIVCCGRASTGIEEQFQKEGFAHIERVPNPTLEGWMTQSSGGTP